MNAADYQRLRDAFHRLRDKPFAEREKTLETVFRDEPELRAELRGLLDSHQISEASPIFAFNGLADAVRDRLVSQMEASDDDLIGLIVGPWTIRRRLGRGAHSTVYLAERAAGQPREVALKLLDTGFGSGSARRRFEQEADILARLDHVGIARLIEAGSATVFGREGPYIAVEHIDGPTLTDYVRRRGLDASRQLDLLAWVCNAVHYANQKGIIHRDLKPSNILVTHGGQPKVLDFGVARLAETVDEPGRRGTQTGTIVGTIAYMSPEQAEGRDAAVDRRSDVYSLGVVGYEMLTGRLPYDIAGRPLHEQLRIIREAPPVPLESIDPRLSGNLESIIVRALAKDPELRYPSARAFATDIRAFLRGERLAPATIDVTTMMRRRPPQTRRTLALAGVAAAIVIGIGGLVGGFFLARHAREGAQSSISGLETDLRETSRLAQRHRDEAEKLISTMLLNAGLLMSDARYDDAVMLYSTIVETQAALYGGDDDRTLATRELLADALSQAGLFVEAVRARRETFDLLKNRLGPLTHRAIDARLRYAHALIDNDQPALARAELQQVLEGRRELLGRNDPKVHEVERMIAQLDAE